MNRRVLIVSPHFPPTNAPDHQRVRMSLPYFSEYGWDPVVLAVSPEVVAAPRDERLADTIPSSVPVSRVGAFSTRWTRFMGVGSLGYRAWFQLNRHGRVLLASGRHDLVYFSTTQFVTTTLGKRWRREFGTPYVVDIQDPWWTDYYSRPGAPQPPGRWKYRFARWQASRLEGRAWRDAAGFVSVSQRYLDDLRARYFWFNAKPAQVIPFGAPEADFEQVRNDRTISVAFQREPERVHLVSVGAVGPIMRPALDTLFSGLASLRARSPTAAARLRLHFIGTSYAPPHRAVLSVLPAAEANGVADLVTESTGRIGYFEAIKTMLSADGLLLPGSDDPAYSPSKIASCFLAGRPVLALMLAGGMGDARVRSLNFATIVAPKSADASLHICNWLNARVNRVPDLHSRDSARFEAEETARAGARRQCAFFDHIVSPT